MRRMKACGVKCKTLRPSLSVRFIVNVTRVPSKESELAAMASAEHVAEEAQARGLVMGRGALRRSGG